MTSPAPLRFCSALTAVIWLSNALSAEAGKADDEEALQRSARYHLRVGIQLIEAKDFGAAAIELEQSVHALTTRNNLYHLAKCYHALQRYGDALALFERLQNEFGQKLKPEMKDDVQKQLADINALVARLTVDVNPPGVTITLNGEPVGVSPLSAPLVLAPGDYTVTATLEGHDTAKETVTLVSATEQRLALTLAPTRGDLIVTTTQTGVTVAVDGTPVGTTPLPAPVRLLEGAYAVTVEKTGYQSIEQRVEIAMGETKTLQFDLEPVADAPAKAPPVVEPSAEDAQHQRLSPVFWAGLAGAVAFAGASSAMWGVTAKKNSDYNATIDRMKTAWTIDDFDTAMKLRKDVPKFNNLAIGMTAATGACLALMVAGLFINGTEEAGPPLPVSVSLRPAPAGIALTF